eukprot:TRINITY_DN34568_c0_g1_i1.p1 TRINITY_DN34568_c0_g1~~TRINITY_DN34568_c0_g1_i1.p1  ORF type:complete len:131 (-),score=21.78 TRINITY_DN34568_c0_g1_i1:76-468(-)
MCIRDSFPSAYQSAISTASAAVHCNNFPSHTWTRDDFAPIVVKPLKGDAKRDNHYTLRTKIDFAYWQPFNSQDGEEQAYRSPASALKYEARYVGDDAVSYTHLRAHETPEHLVCRLLLEKKKKRQTRQDI